MKLEIYFCTDLAISLISSSGVFLIRKLIALLPLTYDFIGISENSKFTLPISLSFNMSPFLFAIITIFSTPSFEVFLLLERIIISSFCVFTLPPEISILLCLITLLMSSKLMLCRNKAVSSISTEIIIGA